VSNINKVLLWEFPKGTFDYPVDMEKETSYNLNRTLNRLVEMRDRWNDNSEK